MKNIFSFQNIFRADYSIITPIVFLSCIGALNIFSTTYYQSQSVSDTFYSQLTYYSIGVSLLLFGLVFNFNILMNKWIQLLIFVATIGLLVAVLFIGVEVGETTRWILIGSFSIQPSEITKLSLIILFAGILHKVKNQYIQFGLFFFIYISFAISIFLQKSLGNTLLLTAIFVSLTTLAIPVNKVSISATLSILIGMGISILSLFLGWAIIVILLTMSFIGILSISKLLQLKKITLIVLLAIFAFGFSAVPAVQHSYSNLLRPYQRERIETYLGQSESTESALAEDYQKTQSLRAIGSAGFQGKGFLNSEFANTSLLPLAESDFAFAAYAEQFGFVGVSFLIGLYLFLITRLIIITNFVKNTFGKYLIYGAIFLILFNTIQHIGMNLGLLPITGVPLPFISLGGSSLLTIFTAFALVLSVRSSDSYSTTKVIRY